MLNFPSQIFVEPTIQLGYLVWYSSGKIRYLELVGHGADTFGWSELAPTNAPVEDEPVQPVLRMNILPARCVFFFT
jgi:hypothetical protein